MMRLLTLLTLLGIATFGSAQQRKAPAAPAARIEGTILNGKTNKPVPAVALSVFQGSDRREVVSDASGRFAFTMTHGTARLFTLKAGYASLRPEGHKLPTNGILISANPGQQIRGLTLKIWPTGSITGAVYDSKSKPVQYARVRVMRYSYNEDGQRTLTPAGPGQTGQSNDHGEFRIADIDPGNNRLQLEPPMFGERVPGEPFTST